MQTLPYPPETVRYWRTEFNTMVSSINNIDAQLARIMSLLDFIDHYHPEVVREYAAWSGVNKRFDKDDTGVATAMADGGAA